MTDLRVDWCDYKAAEFAVKRWHYSRTLPVPPLIRLGVWESGAFIGCVIFSRGTNNNAHKPYDIDMTEFCELTRIALAKHSVSVSHIVALALRMLKGGNPGLRLVASYADPFHDHHGGIYQAGNWIYVGQIAEDWSAIDRTGRVWNSRQVSRTGVKRQFGTLRRVPKIDDCTLIPLPGKYKYLYPLDRAMRRQIAPLAKPYPKRESCGPSVESDTTGDQPVRAGATPAGRSEE